MIIKTRKDRRIANQKAMINNRDKLIGDLKTEIDRLNEEHKILCEENKKGNQAIITLEKVYKLAVCNKYNNEKVILDKIKELVADYQSNN